MNKLMEDECLQCGEPAKWTDPITSGDKLCSICALVAYTEYRDEAIAVYDEFIDALLSNRPDIN